ncbi:MAG: hypothetical protein ACE37K_21285 [Planctomycetota bacterium]
MKASAILTGLLLAHLALGVVRLPGKVWLRRVEEVEAYRDQGAPHFLLGSARLGGADEIAWLCDHLPERCVVLWRWPAKGALEFVAPLIAPRLLVDERLVPADASTFAGLPIATGAHGRIVAQGTEDHGLILQGR